MKSAKRYIPFLIAFALLALIGLQIVWLVFVYKYKQQELLDKTREAVLETTKRLQKEEDSKLILTSIDSLLVKDNIIGNDKKENIRVIVSNIKDKLKIDTLRWEGNTKIESEVKVISDSTTSTTIVKMGEGKTKKVILHSESYTNDNVKKKAGELEALFLKMAIQSNDDSKKAHQRIDFKRVQTITKEELLHRGINIVPKIIVACNGRALSDIKLFSPKLDAQYLSQLGAFNLDQGEYNFISLPLFPEDIINKDIMLLVGFKSVTNFVIKQMAGLLSLSLFITILIGFVMIYTFRRMLSQEKLHTMKNDFINNMTHELKTPIATISLAIDGISNPAIKNDEAKFNNYTSILKEENKKLNSHVERVLQMALLEKGELILDKKEINLKSLLENCLHTQQLQIKNKKAKVVLNAEEVSFNGDEFHLMNAFTNLLDNALKYSGENCEIIISLTKAGEISFKDNGIGIDKTIREKVFEKFYRAQGGNLHDVKGFGLGLSYVKSIIEAHGGTIELKSDTSANSGNSNKGSEFIIKLKVNVN